MNKSDEQKEVHENTTAPPSSIPAVKKDIEDITGSGGSGIQEGLNTIEMSQKTSTVPQCKDSDDISLGRIQPVHNFFGQQQFSPYDSDGSDGSLVFSPGSLLDDHHMMAPTDSSSRKNNIPSPSEGPKSTSNTIDGNMFTYKNRRHESTTVTSNRDRFPSTDSNGSVRYIRSSQNSPANLKTTVNIAGAHECHNQTPALSQPQQPTQPHILPYHERRKLMQHRQYQEQNQHFQYHSAMAQEQHSRSTKSQHQNQGYLSGHSSPSSHFPAQACPIDPRMATAYYQMYGVPPPGVYAPLHPHSTHNQPGTLPAVGYALQPQQLGGAYYHQQIPTTDNANSQNMPHPQMNPSVHQLQYQNSAPGLHQQQYSSSHVSNHAVSSSFSSPYQQNPNRIPPAPSLHGSSTVPQFAPMPQTLPSNSYSSDQFQQYCRHAQMQEKESLEQNQSQQKLKSMYNRSRKNNHPNTGIDDTTTAGDTTRDIAAVTNKHHTSSPIATNNNNRKINPFKPRSRNNNDFHQHLGNSGNIPPPPPPPPPPPQAYSSALSVGSSYHSLCSSYHSRADSHGSISSSLESAGPIGTNFSKDDDDDDESPSHTAPISYPSRRPQRSLYTDDSQKELQFAVPTAPTFNSANVDLNVEVAKPETTQRQVASQHSRKHSFLDMLRMGWSPQSRDSSSSTSRKKPNINEFHRRNQQLLNRPTTLLPFQTSPTSLRVPAMHHRRIGSQDCPPPSRGTHRRLPSISNDEWNGDESHEKTNDGSSAVNEFSSLLAPSSTPSGISTNEKEGKDTKYAHKYRKGNRHYDSIQVSDSSDNISEYRDINNDRRTRKKKYRKHVLNNDDSQDSSDSSFDHRKWTKKRSRSRMLEKERSKLIEQWKVEAKAEAELLRKERESNRWHRRLWETIVHELQTFGLKAFRCLTIIEKFIGNLPLTIGAVALAVVTLGVVWFKFAEEYLDTCEPVHFHSSQCTFPEFPGCFYCDTNSLGYKVAIGFHYTCTVISGLLATLLVAKILLATRVVMDEMSSPTTASPAGLLCMTAVCVFTGRGLVGQILVSTAAFIHLGLVIWFIYMALAYNILPEPSWFPNTVGIGLSAVKIWVYYPMPGHLLMFISLTLNFFFFPISLIRVAVNKKISATVAWMQMSAPAVSLYALTIMAQPSFIEEQPDVTKFQRVHREMYLPCMHVMCAFTLIGMAASIHSLWDRWADFKRKEFSPAHVAFCFPTLSHANSIQAYRGAVKAFSNVPSRSWRMFILDGYWIAVLVGSTVITFWFCFKFMYMLPEWTSPDISNEEEPPAPYETLLSRQHMVTAGDTLSQPFVSPAILQANETGALILSRSARDGTLRYVRTRRIRALGFEPTMNWSEMLEEEDVLLDYVGKHPPRRRHKTLSVPGIDFNYGSTSAFGTNNSGVYGTADSPSQRSSKRRSMSQGTSSTIFLK